MLAGKAADVRRHRWFDGLDWQALEARRMQPPRLPRDDSAKRLKELQARARAAPSY
jgi:cGMP-dependent protein kinase 2